MVNSIISFENKLHIILFKSFVMMTQQNEFMVKKKEKKNIELN
jgi:hypothetical protein